MSSRAPAGGTLVTMCIGGGQGIATILVAQAPRASWGLGNLITNAHCEGGDWSACD